MDINKNYYAILNVSKIATKKELKKSYYSLSFDLHPDRNKDIDPSKFQLIAEAYSILSEDDLKGIYDSKSRFGQFYDETLELLDINMESNHTNNRELFNRVKNKEIINIQLTVPDNFDGSIDYERWVVCKDCGGTGRDFKSKIAIRDEFGNIKGYFETEDGCDYCEGTGKGYNEQPCFFCGGHGKTGMAICQTCKGEMRILGKQKLSNIVLTGDTTKIDAMGHASLTPGRSGYLLLVRK